MVTLLVRALGIACSTCITACGDVQRNVALTDSLASEFANGDLGTSVVRREEAPAAWHVYGPHSFRKRVYNFLNQKRVRWGAIGSSGAVLWITWGDEEKALRSLSEFDNATLLLLEVRVRTGMGPHEREYHMGSVASLDDVAEMISHELQYDLGDNRAAYPRDFCRSLIAWSNFFKWQSNGILTMTVTVIAQRTPNGLLWEGVNVRFR
ncbi:MAG: hypothetical protein AKCLJLPJ_01204 [Fimbriimonadales bacterium]|nr:hypothetical protein [Fimbriimonadales bacterium]